MSDLAPRPTPPPSDSPPTPEGELLTNPPPDPYGVPEETAPPRLAALRQAFASGSIAGAGGGLVAAGVLLRITRSPSSSFFWCLSLGLVLVFAGLIAGWPRSDG